MEEERFRKRLEELCGNDTLAHYNYLKKFEKGILVQSGEENKWRLFNPNHKNNNLKDGVYLTLRCGYGGIYQTYNIWNTAKQKWEIESADGSYTIMYKDIEPYLV